MNAPMKQLVLDMALPTAPSLSNFCVGPNLDALSHLRLWLGEPGSRTRSPLSTYLWGESGSGKSHLLQAMRSALTLRGETVGWMEAGMQGEPPFDERWTCVLMDDVQSYTLRQQHTAFNWFVNAQSQQVAVLAAGSLPPADLKLRDDLRSRLGWGHVFGLKPLDEAERRNVLRQAAQERGLALSDEVMDFMLHRFSRDLGNLMELLTLLDGYALQTQRAITIPLIKSMMDNA
jgi:DnaA family protein